MAKNKKKGLSEKVQRKKKQTEKKVNPFEIKFNRSKQTVLGKKVTKFDKGMPGLSRSKAVKKRESTLLVEYKKRGKANVMMDKRIGEQDADMSLEDKMLARYAAEKKKSHGKSLFNLNDEDEELTHYGQSLAEIEKFEDKAEISDEEGDEEAAKLMQQEQFGGFMSRREDDQGQGQGHKSWKERMDEIIAHSKKAKHERQTEREKSQELTGELDQQWKTLQSLIVTSGKDTTSTETAKPAKDDYDITVGQLKFEVTGKPSDRLKSEDELAKEERERLEKLEEDRLRRMKGIVEEEGGQQRAHKSADDLDDGFDLSTGEKGKVLNYKDGKLVQSESEDDGSESESEDRDDDENEDDDEDDGEDGRDGEDIEDGSEDEVPSSKKKTKQPGTTIKENGGDNDESEMATEGRRKKKEKKRVGVEEKDGEELSEDEDDEDEEESEAGGVNEDENEDEEDEDDDSYSDLDMDSDDDDEDDEKKKFIEKLLKRKLVMEAARKEVPYTFQAPESYEQFEAMLNEYGSENRPLVLDRLRKCTHVSLCQENAEKLKKILSFLFDYIMELCSNESPPSGALLDAMLVHFYQMTQQFPLDAARKMAAEIQLRHEEYKEICGDKAWRGAFPGLDTLVLLKTVGLLFPTSDFTHRVVTPAMLFIAHVLNQSPIRCETDVAVGLFMCNIYLEYQSMSKRIMPEVINFLHSVLFLSLEKPEQKGVKSFPPNIGRGEHDNILLLKIKSMKSNIGKMKLSETIRTEENNSANDDFRLRAIKLCLLLVENFAELYDETAAFSELFHPLRQIVQLMPLNKFPKELKTLQAGVLSKLIKPHPLTYLAKERNKPKPLKLLEPKFDEVFEDRKKRAGSRDFKEKQTLLHKLKKEKKGAIREIRRDTQFMARVKLKETMDRDAERKRKVKEIHGYLANQEGEFKALKRKRTT